MTGTGPLDRWNTNLTGAPVGYPDRATTAGTPDWRRLRTPRSYAATAAAPFPPDTPQRLAFDLLPTSALFRPGDRVRLTLAPANPSSFEPRPAAVTALSWWEPRRPRRRHGLTVRVPLGRERPDYSPCQAQ
ncbi:hypothetical protein [Kitasatospora sp. NPDC001527]|uniref:hypothetical protein n=1 Tax=Kitasatospora sp. NPDC001527 TaxID=3154519 RepID=UPI00331A7A6B